MHRICSITTIYCQNVFHPPNWNSVPIKCYLCIPLPPAPSNHYSSLFSVNVSLLGTLHPSLPQCPISFSSKHLSPSEVLLLLDQFLYQLWFWFWSLLHPQHLLKCISYHGHWVDTYEVCCAGFTHTVAESWAMEQVWEILPSWGRRGLKSWVPWMECDQMLPVSRLLLWNKG